MAVYTQLNSNEVLSIINQYKIGELIEYNGIQEGIENTNYYIKTTYGKFILTIFENRVNLEDIPFFVNLMKHLNQNDFASPEPIQDQNGKIIKNFKNKKFIIVSFLEGNSKINFISEDCFLVGKLIGDLQDKTKSFNLTRKNNLSLEGCNLIFENCKNSISPNKANQIYHNLYYLIETSLNECKLNWPTHLPRGIIHGDLFPDNVFFKNNKISGVIDFYFSCVDIKIYELSIVINAWCFDKNNILNIDKVKNLIMGYKMHNNLTIKELKYVHILSKGACLRFLLTRLFDWFNTPEFSYVKKKDPQEYLQKLNYFNSNTLDFLYDDF